MSSLTKDSDISESPLAFLHGVWESEDAVVSYPTMETTKYYERLEFNPQSAILVDYKATGWHSETKKTLHQEKGFVKINPDNGTVAIVLAHDFGGTELDEGTIDGQSLHLESKHICCISFLDCNHPRRVIRDLVLKGDTLHYNMQLETVKTPLQGHLQVRYKKKE